MSNPMGGGLGNGEDRGGVLRDWTAEIPPEQWEIFLTAIRAVRNAGVEFSLGGAFAVATYSGGWRNTKDLDFYVVPDDRDRAVAAIEGAGFEDYFPKAAYDRSWIRRAHQEGVIVDIIFGMANHRSVVDETWIRGGPETEVRGEILRIVPPEEMIWAKLYVLQKDRCDWPDVFNMLYEMGPRMNWQHLLDRIAEDACLLRGALDVFRWLFPDRARAFPNWIWKRLREREPDEGADSQRRLRLLDSRPWFRPKVA